MAALGSGIFVSACGSKSNPVGPGGECFLATDCMPGLVCLEQPNKTRVCSDDLSRVTGRPPPEAGVALDDAGEGGRPDGASVDAPIGPPPEDSGGGQDTGVTPDTGAPPPMDAGADG